MPSARLVKLVSPLCVGCILFGACQTNEGTDTGLLADLKQMVGQELPRVEQAQSVAETIQRDPEEAYRLVATKLEERDLPDEAIMVYVWALSEAKGAAAGELILEQLPRVSDDNIRFEILNLLGQLQYAPALPHTLEVLKKDPAKYYWQSIFVFTKMGDVAVPFLLEKINDPSVHIRGNSMMVLGNWLIPCEAAIPLQDRFWKEKDPRCRELILGSLERTLPDLDELADFAARAAQTEKNGDVRSFAQEVVDGKADMRAAVAEFRAEKKIDPAVFSREYDKLYESWGRRGDMEVLAAASGPEDEAALEKLRERILQRNSDEAFHDCQTVNGIIYMNRRMKSEMAKGAAAK